MFFFLCLLLAFLTPYPALSAETQTPPSSPHIPSKKKHTVPTKEAESLTPAVQEDINQFVQDIFGQYKQLTERPNSDPMAVWKDCFDISEQFFDSRSLIAPIFGLDMAKQLRSWNEQCTTKDLVLRQVSTLIITFLARNIANLIHILKGASISIKAKKAKPWSHRVLFFVDVEIISQSNVARDGIYTFVAIPQDNSDKSSLLLRDFKMEGISILQSISNLSRELRRDAAGDLKNFLKLMWNSCKAIFPYLNQEAQDTLNTLKERLEGN